jgi:hypothetical protein
MCVVSFGESLSFTRDAVEITGGEGAVEKEKPPLFLIRKDTGTVILL